MPLVEKLIGSEKLIGMWFHIRPILQLDRVFDIGDCLGPVFAPLGFTTQGRFGNNCQTKEC